MKDKFRIALAGNPNCGKTSIFNALTGARQHVGNYPGVTVESKSGSFEINGKHIELIDLPGVYSLSSSSPEEEVVFKELMKPGIDLILNVVDSTIPRRSLYLTTQLAELHIPMFLVFNMADEAKKKGLKYDLKKLERYFGSPIVQTIGSKSNGVQNLLDRLSVALEQLDDHGVPMLTYGDDIDDAINALAQDIDALGNTKYSHIPSRFFAIKLLEHDTCVMNIDEFKSVHGGVDDQIKHLWDKHAIEADTFMADKRYAMLAGACREAITITNEKRREISDKIDAVMTNKFLGLPLFLLIIYLTFLFTFTCAQPFMNIIEACFSRISYVIGSLWPAEVLPYLRSLVTEGIIGGVGGVLVFLPNILFLFFAIAILEDSGYMARAAFVMDGIMRNFGLQGRSFVPLVLGFGCNVPAIMGTRTIESERDRTVTIMVLPMMSCGARLPIYSLIIPALFVRYQASIMCGIYILGVIFALLAARIMKNTLFKGDGEVYLMELPPYRMPTFKSLMLHMWDRGKSYIHKAGTIILFTSIILYLFNTYPQKRVFDRDYDAEIQNLRNAQLENQDVYKTIGKFAMLEDAAPENIDNALLESLLAKGPSEEIANAIEKAIKSNDEIATIENAKMAELMEYTISGRIGKFLEPLFRPIGFDWKLTTASLAALTAKEVFVSQLGILYSAGKTDENSDTLRTRLRENYSPLQGICILVFAVLSVPCLATLAVIKRELNSWKMMAYDALGLFVLAYVTTFVIYQVGMLFQLGTNI